MSQIQQFSDTWTIRNQTIPVGAVVGDLLFLNSSGWNLRTSVNDPIDGYVAIADGATSVVCVGNGGTVWKGGNTPGQIVYEDTANPAKTTVTAGGRSIGKIKSGVGGNIPYEGDSLLIECFWKRDACSLATITQPQADTLGLEDLRVTVCGTGDAAIDWKTVTLDKVAGLFGGWWTNTNWVTIFSSTLSNVSSISSWTIDTSIYSRVNIYFYCDWLLLPFSNYSPVVLFNNITSASYRVRNNDHNSLFEFIPQDFWQYWKWWIIDFYWKPLSPGVVQRWWTFSTMWSPNNWMVYLESFWFNSIPVISNISISTPVSSFNKVTLIITWYN